MFLEGVFDTHPNGVDRNFEWKNRKRTLFLRITDVVVLLFYQLTWKKIVRKFTPPVTRTGDYYSISIVKK